MSQFSAANQPPPAQPGCRWGWAIALIGLGLGTLLCGALIAILVVPRLFPSLKPAPPPTPMPTATMTAVAPTDTPTPTLTPTARPTSTPLPTPLPTSTRVVPTPTREAAPPTAAPPTAAPPTAAPPTAAPIPAPTEPAAPSTGNGTIHLESQAPVGATCRISVWGMGTDFLLDAAPGYPASREIAPGDYNWQAFLGPRGQTGTLSLRIRAGIVCSIVCYDTYVDWGGGCR